MIQLQLLNPLLRLLVYGFLVFCALNASMWLVSAMAPRWINVPKQFFGVDYLSDNLERVYSAEAEWHRLAPGNPELIVILGLSGASEGVALEPMRQRVGENVRLLPLSGAGRNINDIQLYTRPLLDSQLRPDLVIFAISPFHLMDPPEEYLAWSDRLGDVERDTLLLGWFYRKRTDIRNILDIKLLQLRYDLSRQLSSSPIIGDADPWRDSIRLGLPQLTVQSQWDTRLREYGARGYYDEENYREESDQVNRLVSLVSDIRSQGTRVLIVYMPEHSMLRASIPATGLARISEQLAAGFSETDPVEMLDMRNTVPDSGFKDISHLNDFGRSVFSSQLAERLRALGSDLGKRKKGTDLFSPCHRC